MSDAIKYKYLPKGAIFQFVDSHHSLSEYEKVDDEYYRHALIGKELLSIYQCPKGTDEPVVI